MRTIRNGTLGRAARTSDARHAAGGIEHEESPCDEGGAALPLERWPVLLKPSADASGAGWSWSTRRRPAANSDRQRVAIRGAQISIRSEIQRLCADLSILVIFFTTAIFGFCGPALKATSGDRRRASSVPMRDATANLLEARMLARSTDSPARTGRSGGRAILAQTPEAVRSRCPRRLASW